MTIFALHLVPHLIISLTKQKMQTPLLDNPVWSSLGSNQKTLAESFDDCLQYPAEIAPFVAVHANSKQLSDKDAARIQSPCYFAGVVPELPAALTTVKEGRALQMIFTGAPRAVARTNEQRVLTNPDQTILRQLEEDDVSDMLALTAVAFPGYFRRQTIKLGRYYGVIVDKQLVAMAGERMSLTGYRELSGICTHPQHTGKGYAKILIEQLLIDLQSEEVTPFLHVASNNHNAIRLYEKCGFVAHQEIALAMVARV